MKLKTLVIVVALLAAAAAVVAWRNRQPQTDSAADPHVGKSLVERKALEPVRGVSFTSDGKTVTIVADAAGKTWTVPDYFGLPADFSKLSTFIESLQTAKISRFVTASPERLERLGLGSDKIELRDAAGKPLWALTLGKNAETGGRFVRFGDEKKAYLADLTAYLDTTAKNWALSQLLNLKVEEVAAVELKFADGSAFACKRPAQGTGWTAEGLPEGKELKASSIDSLLSQLTGLRFTETTEPGAPEAAAAREHTQTATLTLKDGTAYTIALGRKPAPSPAPETRNSKPETRNVEPLSATTPAVTIGADGKPEVVALPAEAKAEGGMQNAEVAKTEPLNLDSGTANAKPDLSAEAEAKAETQNPKPVTVAATPPPPPQPGPVFAFITANRDGDPVNGLMQKRAFQVGEYAFTSLPANRDALLQDKPAPPLAPAAAPTPAPAAVKTETAPAPKTP